MRSWTPKCSDTDITYKRDRTTRQGRAARCLYHSERPDSPLDVQYRSQMPDKLVFGQKHRLAKAGQSSDRGGLGVDIFLFRTDGRRSVAALRLL